MQEVHMCGIAAAGTGAMAAGTGAMAALPLPPAAAKVHERAKGGGGVTQSQRCQTTVLGLKMKPVLCCNW